LGIEIPLSCQIGPGLAIWHYGGIIFGGGLIAGSNLSVNSGVMIARKHQLSDIATIGDNVSIHAHALILCESIGNNCVIGAGSVVTKNVPENTTVAGNPAKPIIPKTRADVDQTPPS
jgi:serine O-acetyltransferase